MWENHQGFSRHSCQLVRRVEEEPRLLLKEHHDAGTLVHLSSNHELDDTHKQCNDDEM